MKARLPDLRQTLLTCFSYSSLRQGSKMGTLTWRGLKSKCAWEPAPRAAHHRAALPRAAEPQAADGKLQLGAQPEGLCTSARPGAPAPRSWGQREGRRSAVTSVCLMGPSGHWRGTSRGGHPGRRLLSAVLTQRSGLLQRALSVCRAASVFWGVSPHVSRGCPASSREALLEDMLPRRPPKCGTTPWASRLPVPRTVQGMWSCALSWPCCPTVSRNELWLGSGES